VVRFPSGA